MEQTNSRSRTVCTRMRFPLSSGKRSRAPFVNSMSMVPVSSLRPVTKGACDGSWRNPLPERILQTLLGAEGAHIPLVGSRSRAVLKHAALGTVRASVARSLANSARCLTSTPSKRSLRERGNGDGGPSGRREGNGGRGAQTLYPPATSEQPVVDVRLDFDVGGANVQSRRFLQEQPYRIFRRQRPASHCCAAAPAMRSHSCLSARDKTKCASICVQIPWEASRSSAARSTRAQNTGLPVRCRIGSSQAMPVRVVRGERRRSHKTARQQEPAVFPTLQPVENALSVANFNVGADIFVADVRHRDVAAQPANLVLATVRSSAARPGDRGKCRRLFASTPATRTQPPGQRHPSTTGSVKKPGSG